MARRSGHRRTSRDGSHIANVELRRSPLVEPSRYRFLDNLELMEDRRLFDPDPFSVPRSTFGRTTVVDRNVNLGRPVRSRSLGTVMLSPRVKAVMVPKVLKSDRQAFKAPARVVVCVRRQQRKEVMFAKKKAGRGGQRRPRFNWWSRVTCR